MSAVTQIHSKIDLRRTDVRTKTGSDGKPVLNGMDFLEVATPEQTTLQVHFIHPLPGQANGVPAAPQLTAANIVISGGVRITEIRVARVTAARNLLTVIVDQPGDFSQYTLQLVAGPGESDPPAGFDPQLAILSFSFKVACPTDLDCHTAVVCPPEPFAKPDINYLAKDYASFRRIMLDRLALLAPEWTEWSPADLGITLVELLASVADHLSYEQDAVATEAYFGTARRRVSVRRHARLVGYLPFEGCNARVWAQIQLRPGSDDVTLPARGPQGPTRLLTAVRGKDAVLAPRSNAEQAALALQPVVFEMMEDIRLFKDHAEMKFYTWGNKQCCLPAGATRATLRMHLPNLRKGTVLIFKEVKGPFTGAKEDADPAHRHVVRLIMDAVIGVDPLTQEQISEIEWHPEDALPFPLCLSSKKDREHGGDDEPDISVALGNIVLADHGKTVETPEKLDPVPMPRLTRVPAGPGALPPELPEEATAPGSDGRQLLPPRYRPVLRGRPLTHAAPFPYLDETDQPRSARAALAYGRETVRPAIGALVSTFNSVQTEWTVTRDLLTDSLGRPDYVVEMEHDGTAWLRFGDGRYGRRPEPGSLFQAVYRIGNGSRGNIGADTLGHVVTDNPHVAGVTNPLPAFGGREPESLEEIRRNAPMAFRTQDRAVTMDDYAEMTERDPRVQQAAATLRWTGSWHTVFVTVDRLGGARVDAAYETDLRNRLESYRLAGQDIEIDNPRLVALEIDMRVSVEPDYFRSDVQRALLAVFSNRILPDGRRGLFHPDNFSFGQPVYLSPLYAAAQAVAGVRSVVITRFQRPDDRGGAALAQGFLPLGRLEIARCDNDPNFPDRGVFRLVLEGGL
ncbi:MAG TPA: putative baseplate assembly protein [Nitrospiraceae bacterium]|nr:putative baseplate assembly protein [Nitrospiraceae bacterium]